MFVVVDTSVSTDTERPGTLLSCSEEDESASSANKGATSLDDIVVALSHALFNERLLIEYRVSSNSAPYLYTKHVPYHTALSLLLHVE